MYSKGNGAELKVKDAVLKVKDVVGKSGARNGDAVVVLGEGKAPAVLREKESREDSTIWMVIGMAYVRGFMDRLTVDWVKKGLLEEMMSVVL